MLLTTAQLIVAGALGFSRGVREGNLLHRTSAQKVTDVSRRNEKDKNIQQAGFPDGHPL